MLGLAQRLADDPGYALLTEVAQEDVYVDEVHPATWLGGGDGGPGSGAVAEMFLSGGDFHILPVVAWDDAQVRSGLLASGVGVGSCCPAGDLHILPVLVWALWPAGCWDSGTEGD